MDHYITKCKDCGIVIEQCRCMDKNKSPSWSLCEKCKENPSKERQLINYWGEKIATVSGGDIGSIRVCLEAFAFELKE